MQAIGRQRQRAPDGAPLHDERHRPEQATLCRLVQQHAAGFIAHTEASTGAERPRFIKDEFDAFLQPQVPEPPAQAVPVAECEASCAHHRPMRLSWAKLLKRVFEIDLEHSPSRARCGVRMPGQTRSQTPPPKFGGHAVDHQQAAAGTKDSFRG